MTGRRRVGAAAAALGGACWMVKSVGILVTGEQVPLLFEAAPTLFGIAALAMALAPYGETAKRRTSIVAAAVATAAGLVAVASDLAGELFGPAIALSTVSLLVALIALGLRSPRGHWWGFSTPHQIALVLGVATAPAIAVGGVLAELGERLLEAPIAVLGLLWIALGALLWTVGDDAVANRQGHVSR